MRKAFAAALLLTLVAVNASAPNASASESNNNAATSVSQNNLTPEQLGELGAKIKKNPNDAQKLLTEQGLTQESFEKQIHQVAQDPDASKRYAAAYKKAKA